MTHCWLVQVTLPCELSQLTSQEPQVAASVMSVSHTVPGLLSHSAWFVSHTTGASPPMPAWALSPAAPLALPPVALPPVALPPASGAPPPPVSVAPAPPPSAPTPPFGAPPSEVAVPPWPPVALLPELPPRPPLLFVPPELGSPPCGISTWTFFFPSLDPQDRTVQKAPSTTHKPSDFFTIFLGYPVASQAHKGHGSVDFFFRPPSGLPQASGTGSPIFRIKRSAFPSLTVPSRS